MTRRNVRIGVGLFAIAFVAKGFLVQANEFWDVRNPARDVLVVQNIEKIYRPFRQDNLIGASTVLSKSISVGVLPEVANAAKVGDQVPIVVGRGLLGKSWVNTEADFKTIDRTFRVIYVCVFLVLQAV